MTSLHGLRSPDRADAARPGAGLDLDHRREALLLKTVRWVLCGLAAAGLLVSHAVAEQRATFRIGPPFIPDGYAMEETSDCRIVASGSAPSAHLECTPGLGWRLATADGAVVFPASGFLSPDAQWAFPGPQTGVFLSRGETTVVSLPDGRAQSIDFDRLEQVRTARGLPVLAVVWRSGGRQAEGDPWPARLVSADGTVGDPLPGSDMRGVEGARGYTDCWTAVILSAIRVESLPNSAWVELRRASGDGAGALACGLYSVPALAGRDGDGWRRLDPGTLEPAGGQVFASAEEALASARSE